MVKWLILRTSGSKTLPLARSLVAAGIDAWTPVAHLRKRMPRQKRQMDQVACITPTFVFVRDHHLIDMMREASAPKREHPQFSVFKWDGRIPLVSDANLTGLRAEEEGSKRAAAARTRSDEEIALRGMRDAMRRAVQPGTEVPMLDGPFAGMTGVVESSTRKTAWVNFGGLMRVQIDTWILVKDAVGATQPC